MTISEDMKTAYINYAMDVLASRVRVSQAQYELCEQHFRGITSFLDNSELSIYHPNLRPQGSMRLGTAVRNLSNELDFDVDIVVELQDLPGTFTPKMLKDAVGKPLKNSERYGKLIHPREGGKRCWTIKYGDGTHADLLPAAVNDDYARAVTRDTFTSYDDFGLRITDKTRIWEYHYETDRTKWLLSNPIGFAEWFFTMARALEPKHKASSMTFVRATVEPMPKWNANDFLVLQKIICLMKRHRDVMFGDDKEKPISMIITVLAAKAYAKAAPGNLFSTMRAVANGMVAQMEMVNGRRVVLNPVNPLEDFTDRWRKSDAGDREKKFYQWVDKLKKDLEVLSTYNKVQIGLALKEMFGEAAGADTVEELGRKFMEDNRSKKMTSTGVFSSVAGTIAAKPNTFYGKNTE